MVFLTVFELSGPECDKYIQICRSEIFIRTFVRINFSYTNRLEHLFVYIFLCEFIRIFVGAEIFMNVTLWSGQFLGCPESFWIIRTVFDLSRQFLNCPDSF